MTEQVEKVVRPKCDHCGREYYQHIQADGMRLCPVSAFAYRPASSTPPDDSVARIVELEGALRGVIDTADSFCDCSGDEVAAQVKIRARAVLGETSSAK